MLAPATGPGEDELLLLANGTDGEVVFELPAAEAGWEELLDTSGEESSAPGAPAGMVAAFSLRLLRRPAVNASGR